MQKLFDIEPVDQKNKKRKSPNGIATNDLVLSAHTGTNDALFPHILDLFVPKNSLILDATFGKGVFWRQVDKDKYRTIASDIRRVGDRLIRDIDFISDSRSLPLGTESIDCVVFDPPYMHTPGGSAHSNHQNFEQYYANNVAQNKSRSKYHDAVLDLYLDASLEAFRVLKDNGTFMVKCQDEVCANRQRLTHVEIIVSLVKMGFVTRDLFVLQRNGKPGVSRMLKQNHARKNHSYFLVFVKDQAGAIRQKKDLRMV